MSERCEPPEGMREVEGHHWLKYSTTPPEVHEWVLRGDGLFYWQRRDRWNSPSGAWERGWRYVARVTPPAEVAALHEEIAKLRAENETMRRLMALPSSGPTFVVPSRSDRAGAGYTIGPAGAGGGGTSSADDERWFVFVEKVKP